MNSKTILVLLVLALAAGAVATAQLARSRDPQPADPRWTLRQASDYGFVVYGCRRCGSAQLLMGPNYLIAYGSEVVRVDACPACFVPSGGKP